MDGEGNPVFSNVPYKSDLIGNSRLNISFGETQLEENSYIKLKFNGKKGNLEYGGLVNSPDENLTSLDTSPENSDIDKETKISFSFGNTYTIIIYDFTGEHGIS